MDWAASFFANAAFGGTTLALRASIAANYLRRELTMGMVARWAAGRAAVVTGAASGIGRECARQLAEAGASVVVADRDAVGGEAVVEGIVASGGIASFYQVEVADDESVAGMVRRAVDLYGGLHFAVNNAGISSDWLPLAQHGEEGFQRVVDVNMKGVFLCMKHEILAMLEGGGGSIVNVASAMGLVAMPLLAPYVAAKHGVIGLTRTAMLDYALANIRVNAVCPGVVRTALLPDGAEEAMAPTLPMGRIAEPEEIAAAATWLCSDAASYVTGVALPVDGGHTAR